MPRISASEIAVLQGTLISLRDSMELLLTADLGLDDMAKGVTIGVFAGVPAQVKHSLEILKKVQTETEKVNA